MRTTDLPKAIRDWPDLKFCAYHSGYFQAGNHPEGKDGITEFLEVAETLTRRERKRWYAEIGSTFAIAMLSESLARMRPSSTASRVEIGGTSARFQRTTSLSHRPPAVVRTTAARSRSTVHARGVSQLPQVSGTRLIRALCPTHRREPAASPLRTPAHTNAFRDVVADSTPFGQTALRAPGRLIPAN